MKTKNQWTYGVRAGGHIKIGKSGDINTRLAGIQTCNALPARVFFVTSAPEAALHSLLKKFASGGGREWFVCDKFFLLELCELIVTKFNSCAWNVGLMDTWALYYNVFRDDYFQIQPTLMAMDEFERRTCRLFAEIPKRCREYQAKSA